jgi:AcrR family transcriptional regulator
MGRPPRPDLRDALLDAARAEFARHGLERARVEDVARRAGASKGAFYLHFQSKEQAFEEILQRFMGAFEDQARRREEAEEAFRCEHAHARPAELRTRQMEFDSTVDLELLEMLWRSREFLAVIEGAGGERSQRTVDEFRQRMQRFVSERMALKQARGWIRKDVDPALLGDILVGTFEGFARRMFHMKKKPDLGAWLRSFTEILYEGVLGSAAQPAARPGARVARSASAGRRRAG